MGAKWPKKKVIELQNEGYLLVEDGNHGEYRPRREEFDSEGTFFIRAADMSNGRVLFESAAKINETALDRIRKGIGKPGDVILSHKGTVGKVAFVPSDAPPFVCSPQTTFWRTLDNEYLDRQYLYAFIQSAFFSNQLASVKGETDMADYVSLTAQRAFDVIIPPLKTQKAIAHILGTLDDKIELNRRMNRTLEAMARALFKSWFVDFDPVRAKMAGRAPDGMDAQTAALFPDRLVDSELGEVPEGWEVKKLGEVIELAYGKALKAGNRNPGSIPVFGSNGAVGWHDESLVDGPGIIVGRKGNPGIIKWCQADFFPIDTTFYVVAKGSIASLHFLFHSMELLDLPSFGADSAVPGLNRNMAYMSLVVVPPKETVKTFDEIIKPVFNKMEDNEKESRTLAALRDALLPMLLSGEVRVETK